MGPGKADLLDAIVAQGSISRAAKAMDMSYRRAWLLVDVMNRCWSGPLVDTVPGGGSERGARVTPLGLEILQHYRSLQAEAKRGTAAETASLSALLAAAPRPSQI